MAGMGPMVLLRQIVIYCLVVALFLCVPDVAHAQLRSTICAAYDLISTDAGPGIATIAVAALGVGAAFGKVSWPMAVTVVIGIAVLFSAKIVATALVNSSC